MGTNYYWYEHPPCGECNREFKEIHIGKSSYGWVFMLHIIPEDNINTLEDWKILFDKPDSYIKDEYGKVIHKEEMISIIVDRKKYLSSKNPYFLTITDTTIHNSLSGECAYVTGEFS